MAEGTVTLKAQAFMADRTPSPILWTTYLVTSDWTPPTIVAEVSPPPSAGGWHAAPPTVTFTCADAEFDVTQCGPPRTVTVDGAGTIVVGTAGMPPATRPSPPPSNDISEAKEGRLSRAVRQAMARGESATSVFEIQHSTEGTLGELTTEASVLVVSAARSPAASSRDDDAIFTWHLLHVDETLWAAPGPEVYCERGAAPPVPVGTDEVALKLPGGSAVVEGITVTFRTGVSDVKFDSGKRYVLLAVLCLGRSAVLAQGEFNVFDVDSGDRISARTPSNFAFASELTAFGSLERLRAHFREKRSG